MTNNNFCGLRPLFFHPKPSRFEIVKSVCLMKNPENESKMERQRSRRGPCNFILIMELRRKIYTFRDIIDLLPCDGTESINELVTKTIKDLYKFQSEIMFDSQLISEFKEASIDKVLIYFCEILRNLGDSWTSSRDWMDQVASDMFNNIDILNSKKSVEMALATLDCIINIAKDKFVSMDEDEENGATPFDAVLNGSYSDSSSGCVSPVTPNSVLPQFSPSSDEFANTYSSSPLLRSLRVQAVGKLNPIDPKHLAFSMLSNISTQEATDANRKSSSENETMEVVEPEETMSEKDTSNNFGVTKGVNFKDTTNCNNENGWHNVVPLVTLPESVASPPILLQPMVVTQLPPSPTPPLLNITAITTPQPPPPPLPPSKTSGITTTSPPPLSTSKTLETVIKMPPPPPPLMSLKGTTPLPPASQQGNNIAPPPPPLGAMRSLRPKKAQTKLRRSSQMGNLYRILKGKIEGGNQSIKSGNGRKSSSPNSTSGKQGMADALAEMTKRSAYFQQIEEDVQKYSKSIRELKKDISAFKTNDMMELIKFHKYAESILEHLTDETQVLARFEGFPQKKLEALRTAAVLCSKLNEILSQLQNWKIEAPLGKLLDKADSYFNKIKKEIDALERTKDEDSKKFQSHNINFDFHILLQIKESMVDVSSNCMELALLEKRGAKVTEPKKANAKMLWRAFQFAFRVYSFAGGHDDRADKLTKELAHEIQTDPHHQ